MKLEQILIKHFEWTEQEVKEKANIILHVTFKDEQKVLDKAKFYQQEFDLSRTDFIKMLKVLPTLLNLSEESVKGKADFYQQEFDLSRLEFIKRLKVLPSLLSYAEESVKAKAGFYQQEFDLDKADFIKMLKGLPTLLNLSEESVKAKADFYKQEFDLNKAEFIKMLKSLPALLGLSEDSIKAKANFYQQEFDLNRAEFIKMLKGLPVLLSLLEESVKEKHKQILDLNIPKSVIIKNPNILTVPTNTLKVRYTILRQVATREDILSKIWFMTSQDKTYARLRYLQNKSNKIKISHLLQDEKRFVNAYGVESKELMKIYKLTPEAIHKMQAVLEAGEMAEFSEEENQFINEEYGV